MTGDSRIEQLFEGVKAVRGDVKVRQMQESIDEGPDEVVGVGQEDVSEDVSVFDGLSYHDPAVEGDLSVAIALD